MPRMSHGRPDLRPTAKEPDRAGHGWTQWVLRNASSLASPGGNDYRAGPLLWIPGREQALPAKGTEMASCQRQCLQEVAMSCKFRYKL